MRNKAHLIENIRTGKNADECQTKPNFVPSSRKPLIMSGFLGVKSFVSVKKPLMMERLRRCAYAWRGVPGNSLAVVAAGMGRWLVFSLICSRTFQDTAKNGCATNPRVAVELR
jgi:hypothetical protein